MFLSCLGCFLDIERTLEGINQYTTHLGIMMHIMTYLGNSNGNLKPSKSGQSPIFYLNVPQTLLSM